MATTISVEELVAELDLLKRKGDDDKSWVTTREICDRTGMSQKHVLGTLCELKKAGRLLVSKRKRLSLTDRLVSIDCYQILPAVPVKVRKSR